MMTTRAISVGLSEILSLIGCAEDYGFQNDVLMDAFATMLGHQLSDEEIEQFASSFLTPEMVSEGYGPEDADEQRERLIAWRNGYCNGANVQAP
jgi:hypothetical protein